MASLEKLVKALEALKVFQPGAPPDEAKQKKEPPLSKKDQISNCNVIMDCICSPSLRNIPDFPKFLGIAMETMLSMCDDPESDVRMVADECLNKTIKKLLETNQGRLQVELYKEIKKNGAARCVRAAMWRFAELCPLIRPQKCRPYVINLLPCFARVCRRPEEAVQETLAAAMLKICPVLMGFTTDAEVKILLKAFLPNIKSSSACTRRTAASTLTLVCQYSRKPQPFFSWLLTNLLVQVLPVSEETEVPLLLGLFLSLRHMIPQLSDDTDTNNQAQGNLGTSTSKDNEEVKVTTQQLVQVYELLLHYTSHADHNVVTGALETLQQLLRSPPSHFLSGVLMAKGGIKQTSIYPGDQLGDEEQNFNRTGSAAQLPTDGDDNVDNELEDDAASNCSSSSSNAAAAVTLDEDPVEPSDLSPNREPLTNEPTPEEVNGNRTHETTDGRVLIVGENQRYSGIEIGEAMDGGTLSTCSSMDTLSEPISRISNKKASQDRLSEAGKDGGKEIDVSEVIQQNQSMSTLRVGDIGSIITSPEEIPLVHCGRLLASKFLLTGHPQGLIPDRQARVSSKALALGCMAAIVSVYPRLFAMKVHISAQGPGELQNLRDLLAYTSHSDPQLKGSTALLIGGLLKAVLTQARGRFSKWSSSLGAKDLLSIEELMMSLTSILDDESAVAVRLALVALRSCMPAILESSHSDLGLKAILALLQVHKNPYWLVKVELLDLLSEVDMKVISYLEVLCTHVRHGQHHYTGRLNVQHDVLHCVVLPLLSDEDGRVRHAAATVLCRLVPNLYHTESRHHIKNSAAADPVIARAHTHSMANLSPMLHEGSTVLGGPGGAASSLVQPYLAAVGGGTEQDDEGIEAGLSRIVAAVIQMLGRSDDKHSTLGCCRALSVLSERFPVTVYSSAWCCMPPPSLHTGPSQQKTPQHQAGPGTARSVSTGSNTSVTSVLSGLSLDDLGSGCGGGPLPLIMALLTSSHAALDLTAHHDALKLAGNVFAGAAYKCLRRVEDNSPLPQGEDQLTGGVHWAALGDRMLVPLADILLTHLARMLNICSHILDDVNPGPPVSNKPTLPSLPNAPSLSPIKRKAKGESEKQATEAEQKGKGGKPMTSSKDALKDPEKEKGGKKDALGSFYNLPHYMKLYDVLKGAYSNYQSSLECEGSRDKYGSVLRAVLEVLSIVLEIAGLAELGRHADELLTYLKSTISLEPTPTLLCVQQLWKSVFGTNLAAQWDSCALLGGGGIGGSGSSGGRLPMLRRPGLYHCCFTAPYTEFTQCLATGTFRMAAGAQAEVEETTSWLGRMKKKAEKKIPGILKSGSKTDKAYITSYIRLFEPLVIKALKQYTVTSSLELQTQVLSLLSQLLQLHVNYCMLDSDQIFIGFVIKQFEFIENGQIRNSELLIPQIFHFLVLLSYGKYHSKPIIGMPKIIQLCDGIMASGQDPQTHAIPALQSIVHDLFVLRSTAKSDASRDLDTQREVVVSMLLKLIRYHQVLELLIVVLHQCHKESEEKWKRLSRQVIDDVLPLLAKQQISVDSQVALDVVHRLFEAVAPSVFRPVDILLKTMFAPPTDLGTVTGVQRWLCLILASLRVLIAQSKEETVLSRLQELALTVAVFKQTLDKHKNRSSTVIEDGPEKAESPLGVSAEEVMARYLLQVVGLVAMEIRYQTMNLTSSDYSFLCQEMAHLLLYVMHMFQSGVYRRVATVAESLIRRSSDSSPGHFYTIDAINTAFRDIAGRHPTIALQWCNLLILMNFNDRGWWSDVLHTQRKYMISRTIAGHGHLESTEGLLAKTRCINLEIMRRGGVILFCDYVRLKLVKEKVKCENLTDAEQMTFMIVDHVNDLIQLSTEPPVQDLIGAIHRNSAASGLFIQAIHSRCENFTKPSLVKQTLHCIESIHPSQSGALLTLLIDKFLPTKHLAVARLCDSIACRRLEMLLAENRQSAQSQLPLEDLDKLLQCVGGGSSKRHPRLVTLLYKLREVMTNTHNPLATQPPPHQSTHPLAVTAQKLTDITINKDWFLSITRDQCFHGDISGNSARDAAHLLQHLDYTSLLNVIMSKECRLSVLAECLAVGMQRSVEAYQQYQDASPPSSTSPPHSPSRHKPLDPLFKAAQITLFRHINSVINTLPVPHQVISYSSTTTAKEEEYREKLEDIFSEQTWFDTIFQLADALLRYMTALETLPWHPSVPEETQKDIGRFAILCLELLHWMAVHDQFPSTRQLEPSLCVLSAILRTPSLAAVMGEKEQSSWVCTAVRALHQLLSSALVLPQDRLVTLPNQDSSDDDHNDSFDDLHHAVRACDQMSELVHCLRTHLDPHQLHASLPAVLASPIRNIIVGLARLPLVNSYARTPPLVWRLGWLPSPSGDMRTRLPPLPLHFLQERDVLREFIYRVHLLGWTSRQQFEETWMCLLGVLNPVSLQEDDHRMLSPEEEVDRVQCQVLATRCITSLLVQSSLTPHSGNPANSTTEHKPRDKPLAFLQTKVGKKLAYVRGIVEREQHSLANHRSEFGTHSSNNGHRGERDHKTKMFVNNLDRYLDDDSYNHGQMSVESIWALLGMIDPHIMHESSGSDTTTDGGGTPVSAADSPQVFKQLLNQFNPSFTLNQFNPSTTKVVVKAAQYPPLHRLTLPLVNMVETNKERSSSAGGLDIHSCLQFLLELYGQLLSPTANPRTPLMQLNQTIKSVVALSDIFTEKAQFEWLLDTLLEIQKTHPAEDEIVNQYLVVGICKAAAVIGTDAATLERIVKILQLSLASTHLPTKISALFGCLYLLETGLTEVSSLIVPLLTDYLTKSLSTLGPINVLSATILSHQHVLVMWACTFYVLENLRDEIKDLDFHARILIICHTSLTAQEENKRCRHQVTPLPLYLAMMTGLERLVLADAISQQEADSLVKLSVDRLCLPSPQRALAALGLMLTCMYADKTYHPAGKQTDQWSPTAERESPDFSTAGITNMPQDPESLIVAMERVTVLFDRIRKGFPYEARVISRVLPMFLADFFPPQDIMNKVIGEFLSAQQPHPQLMATVLFQVFGSLIERSQHATVQDWVMLSLSNFTQRTPAAMAVWSLTCFFISASPNTWIRALLSHVISRMGRLELVDQRLFVIAALDFKQHLTDATQLRAFLSTFQAASQAVGLPYSQLLACCNAQ